MAITIYTYGRDRGIHGKQFESCPICQAVWATNNAYNSCAAQHRNTGFANLITDIILGNQMVTIEVEDVDFSE